MARVIITLKIMPVSPEVNLDWIAAQVENELRKFGCELGKKLIEPIAFGLEALKIMFVMDEEKGSTERLESQIAKIPGVNSVEVVDVRRAIG